MSIICSLFGHKLDEEKIITINRKTNIPFKFASRHLQICERCKCLIASYWELHSSKTNKEKK